ILCAVAANVQHAHNTPSGRVGANHRAPGAVPNRIRMPFRPRRLPDRARGHLGLALVLAASGMELACPGTDTRQGGRMHTTRVVALLAAFSCAASGARAQYPQRHDGFWIGFGLGYGW